MPDDLATRPPVPVPRTLAEQLEFAEVVVKSGLALGHRTKESVVIALQLGAELGFSPMQSLRMIAVINGRPSPSADCLVAAVMASGKCEYFREIPGPPHASTWETKRVGAPAPQRYTFTMADAKAAKLDGKENWRMYEARMLAARAKKYLAQDAYADIIGGLMSIEEASDIGKAPVPLDAQGMVEVSAFPAPPVRETETVDPEPEAPTLPDPPSADSIPFDALKAQHQVFARLRTLAEKSKNRSERFDVLLAAMKNKMGTEFGKEHFHELTAAEYAIIGTWLDNAQGVQKP